jgi:nucleoside-diphosphate-sugar epimerase
MNQLEGKVILVTGAHGFIGAHLSERLSKIAGVKLLLLSRQVRKSTQENVICLQSEFSQLTPGYWQSNEINRIDYVFHLGAFIPKTTADADNIGRAIDDNITGTRALLQSLPGNPDKLVFSSTLDVYASWTNGEVGTELSKVAPNTLYGASKLICEKLVAAWANERGSNYATLRYGHIYGPGEERYGKLIPVVIRKLLANQAPVVHGDGSALRDYLYVGDAVEATIRAALVVGNIEPINIVRGESATLKEIVQLLIRLFNSKKEISFLPDKPNGNSLRFDNDLMTKILGSWSMIDLAEGLTAEVDAFRRIKK